MIAQEELALSKLTLGFNRLFRAKISEKVGYFITDAAEKDFKMPNDTRNLRYSGVLITHV